MSAVIDVIFPVVKRCFKFPGFNPVPDSGF